MNMRQVIIFVGLLFVTFPSYSETVEIWGYAFTTRTDEPIAGHGASIFKVDGGDLVGPLLSQEKVNLKLSFNYSGRIAHGMLSSKAIPDKNITLEGVVNYSSENDGCLVEIILRDGVHNIVLERLTEYRCEA